MIKGASTDWFLFVCLFSGCFFLFVCLVQFGLVLIKNTIFSTFSQQKSFIVDVQNMFPFGEVRMKNSCSSSKSHEVQLTFFLLSIFYSVSVSVSFMNIS